jgi:hypothetical protein
MIRLSEITCSDKRMDIKDKNQLLDTPTNRYEIHCEECNFPNIDKTPSPYFLTKGKNFSGIEISIADLGNLLISDRVKKVFEILIPEDCDYQETYIENTLIKTQWWLAIPRNKIQSGKTKNVIPVCSKCKEPLHAHPGSQYEFWFTDLENDNDILKSSNWHSVDEKDWKISWIGRDIFLSVRLIHLLKKIKAKGIYQVLGSKYKKLLPDEKKWIKESIDKIGDLANLNPTKEPTQKQIDRFLKLNGVTAINPEKVSTFEKRFKIKTNDTLKYLSSINKSTKIKVLDNLDFEILNSNDWELLKDSKKLIKFAENSFGDSLYFDQKEKHCAVYYFDHETMIYDLIFKSIYELTDD